MSYWLIALGGAIGSVARFACSTSIATRTGSLFPWGTLTVNVVGSLLIGVALGALEPTSRWQVSETVRSVVNQFFMIGVLGGFTTFSSFSLQTLDLLRHGHWLEAGANVALSVALCLLAVAMGYWLGTR
jgi:fluoride exporter